MTNEGDGLAPLARDECLRLMATVPVGRVVYTDRALPAIQPVNFVLDDGHDVIIRTERGSALAAALRGAIVAFQADDIDTVLATGWSVTVVGPATHVTCPAEIARLDRLPLRPWAPGRREHYVRIASRHVTGRRVTAPGPRRAAGTQGRATTGGHTCCCPADTNVPQ
ncbi:pyridoxamine 5'-phosphate oxidase family protein [Actinomadura viridis]|uniref:pyridoxamine 5'-phosphate oxidase family protein n=1 Tax=Actinomadura viridis TaxID=58110 RepID=UPI0036784055